MSEVVKMETNNPSFLEGLQNYSSKRDIIVEQTIKERMEIDVTDRMRDLLTINDVLMGLMMSLNDERLIGKIDDDIMSINGQLCEEVRNNLYVRSNLIFELIKKLIFQSVHIHTVTIFEIGVLYDFLETF